MIGGLGDAAQLDDQGQNEDPMFAMHTNVLSMGINHIMNSPDPKKEAIKAAKEAKKLGVGDPNELDAIISGKHEPFDYSLGFKQQPSGEMPMAVPPQPNPWSDMQQPQMQPSPQPEPQAPPIAAAPVVAPAPPPPEPEPNREDQTEAMNKLLEEYDRKHTKEEKPAVYTTVNQGINEEELDKRLKERDEEHKKEVDDLLSQYDKKKESDTKADQMAWYKGQDNTPHQTPTGGGEQTQEEKDQDSWFYGHGPSPWLDVKKENEEAKKEKAQGSWRPMSSEGNYYYGYGPDKGIQPASYNGQGAPGQGPGMGAGNGMGPGGNRPADTGFPALMMMAQNDQNPLAMPEDTSRMPAAVPKVTTKKPNIDPAKAEAFWHTTQGEMEDPKHPGKWITDPNAEATKIRQGNEALEQAAPQMIEQQGQGAWLQPLAALADYVSRQSGNQGSAQLGVKNLIGMSPAERAQLLLKYQDEAQKRKEDIYKTQLGALTSYMTKGNGNISVTTGGPDPGASRQSQALTSTQQLLESARGNPAASQAEKDIYSAAKVKGLINLYGNPNNLNMQMVKLAAAEVAKIAQGGAPTMAELEGLTPGAFRGKTAELAEKFVNHPEPANAGAFLKQLDDYSSSMERDAQKVILDKYGRIIESRKRILHPDDYRSLHDEYLDRFKPIGPVYKAPSKMAKPDTTSSEGRTKELEDMSKDELDAYEAKLKAKRRLPKGG